jgi:hypothetical protein
VSRCSVGVPAVASFLRLVRERSHQTVSRFLPVCASVAAPEAADGFASLRLSRNDAVATAIDGL